MASAREVLPAPSWPTSTMLRTWVVSGAAIVITDFHVETAVIGSEQGRARFKGFYGEYELTVHAGGKTVTRDIHLTKQGARQFNIVL